MRNFTYAVLLAVFSFGTLFSQTESFKKPVITDEMTMDPDQNEQWRAGQYPYAAAPKNMWELGINVGHFFIDGDVDPEPFKGWGLGLSARKAFHYIFSTRFDLFYGSSRGLDPQRSSSAVMDIDLIPSAANIANELHRNYKTNYFAGSVSGIINIGNILFHRERNKWNWYVVIGGGFDTNKTMIDALNGNSAYDFSGVNINDLNSKSRRKEVKDDLRSLMDRDYETDARKKYAIFRVGDETNFHAFFTGGMGVSRKINKRWNIGIEHQIFSSDNDLLDGFEYRTVFDQSNNNEVAHYTSVRIGINLGDFDKRTEPLYWLNPIDGSLGDIAQLKTRPRFDLTDTDGDGVIDLLDQELNTSAGVPVDTRGITLDSDGDGVADFQDEEPFSPPGFDVDVKGIATIEQNFSEADIINIINQRLENVRTDWFLPMIHFDLDKYYVKPEFYGQLHHVASVMEMHPDLKVSVLGHTDVRNPNSYNTVLSYKRAKASIDYLVDKYNLPRERFLLQYGGENAPLIGNLPDHHRTSVEVEKQQYMNRRVEFRVANENDVDMTTPTGPDAGKNSPKSSRPGSKYSGNRNSGY